MQSHAKVLHIPDYHLSALIVIDSNRMLEQYLESTVNATNSPAFLNYVEELLNSEAWNVADRTLASLIYQVLQQVKTNLDTLIKKYAFKKPISRTSSESSFSSTNSMISAMSMSNSEELERLANQYLSGNSSIDLSSLSHLLPKAPELPTSSIVEPLLKSTTLTSHIYSGGDKNISEHQYAAQHTSAFDANGAANSCAAVALGTLRSTMYTETAKIINDPASQKYAEIAQGTSNLLRQELQDHLILQTGQALRNVLGAKFDELLKSLAALNEVESNISFMRKDYTTKTNQLLAEEKLNDLQLSQTSEDQLIDILQAFELNSRLSSDARDQIRSMCETLDELQMKREALDALLQVTLKSKDVLLNYLKMRYEPQSGYYKMLEVIDVLNYAIAVDLDVIIYKETQDLENEITSLALIGSHTPHPDTQPIAIVLKKNQDHFERLKLLTIVATSQPKKPAAMPVVTEPYITAKKLWSELNSPEGWDAVVKKFIDADCFDSHYRLGEIYLGHMMIPYGAGEIKYHALEKQYDKAIKHFMTASKHYKKQFGEIAIKVDGKITTPIKPHKDMQLEEINLLCKDALKGNPDALYKLGHFYYSEAIAATRKIETPELDAKAELLRKSQACFESAAKLFHPQAASIIMELFPKQYDIPTQLRFAMTMADPSEAERTYPTEKDETMTNSRQVQLRNDQLEMTNPKNLKSLGETPAELFEYKNAISNAGLHQVGGISSNSVAIRKRCYVPENHIAFGSTKPAEKPKDMKKDSRRGFLAALEKRNTMVTAPKAPDNSSLALK